MRLLIVFFLVFGFSLGSIRFAAAESSKIYFASLRTGDIYRSNVNGNGQEAIGKGTSPRDIAYDSVNGNIYWVDQESDTLHRAGASGGNAVTLLGFDDGVDIPTGIDVDSAAGKLYFTTGGLRKIVRTDLDGSNMETLIDTKLFGISEGPVGVAIDVPHGKIYWTQKFGQLVQRANLADGSDIETVLDLKGTDISSAGDIEVDPVGGKLYIHGGGEIVRANLDGSQRETLYTTLTTAATGLAIDPETNALLWTEVDFFGSLDDRVHLGDMDGGPSSVVLTKFSNDLENPYALEFVRLAGSVPPQETILTPNTSLNAPLVSADGGGLTLSFDVFTGVSLTSALRSSRARSGSAKKGGKLTYRYAVQVLGPSKQSSRKVLTKKDTVVLKNVRTAGEYNISYSAIIYSKLTKQQKAKAVSKGKKGFAASFRKRGMTESSPSAVIQVE